MQVSVETTSGLERRLTVGVPAERVDKEVEARLAKAAKTIKLDGFRPGKVPVKVVKQRFGAGVRQEVLGEVMSQSYYEAIQQQSLRPAGQPSIEPKSTDAGRDLEFVATFEVYPDITLSSFSKITVEKPVATVTDADVEQMLETLRKQHAVYESVDRAAKLDDQVNIDYRGTRDGEAFDGGSAEGSNLVLGSGQMIPGFEDGIVGMQAGDSKELALTFPEDYHAEELKGASVIFSIKVNEVKEKKLPELDPDFFAKFGVKEGGLEAFSADIRENMERELKQGIKNRIKNQVMEGLLKIHDIQIPQALVKSEIDALRKQAFQQFGAAAANFDASILPDDLFKSDAERRVSLGLLLAEVVKKQDIKPDAARVRAAIEEFAASYEEPEKVVEWYFSNEQQLASVESMVMEDMVIDRILEEAEVTERDASYEDVMKPAEPTAEEGES